MYTDFRLGQVEELTFIVFLISDFYMGHKLNIPLPLPEFLFVFSLFRRKSFLSRQ